MNIEVLNRNETLVKLISITSKINNKKVFKGVDLEPNKRVNFKESLQLETNQFSDPYWLKEEWSLGMYKVDNQKLIGKPETEKQTKVDFDLIINNVPVTITKNMVIRYAERDKGEIYEPFEILPKVTIRLKNKVLIFSDSVAKKVEVQVRAGANYINGEVRLKAPKGWQVSPEFIPFNIAQRKDIQKVIFTVTPPKMNLKAL